MSAATPEAPPSCNQVDRTNWEAAAVHSFDDMPLKEDLLRGIYAYGFERPSALQQRGILPITSGRDTILEAQSGTGKTAAYVIGVLQSIDETLVQCQALLLAPTRELARHVERTVVALGDFLHIKAHACIGDAPARDDMRALEDGVHVVVGTPGRMCDMISRQALHLEHLKILVLDEADEMLRIGFKDQLHDIFLRLPQHIQVCLFSATMPPELSELTQRLMRKPVHILIESDEGNVDGHRQFFVNVEKEEWKLDTLLDLCEALATTQFIVFASTRRKVEWITAELQEREFSVSFVHADMERGERDITVKEFRSGSSRVLVSHDLGKHAFELHPVRNLVINFDLPNKAENYIRRVGRSERFGRRRAVINLTTNEDVRALQEIREYYSTEINELPADIAWLQ